MKLYFTTVLKLNTKYENAASILYQVLPIPARIDTGTLHIMPPPPALTSQSGKLPLSITQPSHPPNQISNNLNCEQELLLFYPKVDKLQLTSPSALSHPLRSMAVANVAFTPLSQRKKLFQLTAPPPLPHRPVKLMLISPSALPLREVTLIPLLPLPLRV